MKKYKYPKTYKLVKQLEPFLEMYKIIEQEYYSKVCKLEEGMNKVTKIDGIEFIFCDNECVGIGNLDRTMELIDIEEIEDEDEKTEK